MNFTDPCFENTVRALMETFKTAFVPETYREVALSRMLSGKAAPSPYREFTECELQDHAIQLAALGMCCINKTLWEGRATIEEYLRQHFIPRKQVLR